MASEVTLDGLNLMLVQMDGKLGVLSQKIDSQYERLTERLGFAERQTEQRILTTEQKATFTETRLESRIMEHEGLHKAADVVLNEKLQKVIDNVDSLRIWRAKVIGVGIAAGAVSGGAAGFVSHLLSVQ